jgi:hypothetical protein
MNWARLVLVLLPVAVAAALLVSGDSGADPETPPALPGMPAPFLGTAVVGDGGLTAAVDAYGDVVDLRRGPAARALIDNPVERQLAGSVPAGTGIVPRVRIDSGSALPLWRADTVRQRYLPRTNVPVTVARFAGARIVVKEAAWAGMLAIGMRAWPRGEGSATAEVGVDVDRPARCRLDREVGGLNLVCGVNGDPPRWKPERVIAAAARGNRRWLRRARQLGAGAPPWAEQMYERSLLVLRALTERGTGVVAAGARDGWSYVWPRDAATTALAFAAAGYRPEAERVTRFLLDLGLEGAARFHGDGSPVAGRAAQGDAIGWVGAAAHAAGIGGARPTARIFSAAHPAPWRQRSDYREGESGDFLANAIASGVPAGQIAAEFGGAAGLTRTTGHDGGLDSAAAWAVRPFPRPSLFGAVRRTLLRLSSGAGRFGLVPGEDWTGGEDPWSAPTAWTAWSLAALARAERNPVRARADRRAALRLLADLRRAATPAGALPERVDARRGTPRSTTPLAWSHAFAILALRELWPPK